MSELSDYKRIIEKPMVESYETAIRNLRAELHRTNGELRNALERVTGLLETWAADHSTERTAEIDAAIFCAREVIAKTKS